MVSILIALLLFALAGPAHAATFSVTSKNRHFCCTNNPPGFIAGIPAKNGGHHTVQSKAVTVGAGTAPSIKVGKSEVVQFYSMRSQVKGGATSPPPGFKYIKGIAGWVNGAGTLKKGGGPGNFSFCPFKKGPGTGVNGCAAPALATPPANGRMAVKSGANKFGGTLSLIAGGGAPGGSINKIWRWIGTMSMYPAAIVDFKLYESVIGAAPAAKAKIITGLKTKLVTHTGGSMLSTKAYFTNAQVTVNGAGAWTTGMVYLSVTKNGTPSTRTFSYAGYDKRTAMGAGNIQLVAGELFNTKNNIKPGSFVIGMRLRMPEPSPSLGIAAGALALLLLGALVGGRGGIPR